MAIDFYYYNNQLRSYIVQFASIFNGLKVRTGKGGPDNTVAELSVPIHVGNMDRVVATLAAGNTPNKPISLPVMSCYMRSIELAPDRRKGIGFMERKTFLPAGEVYPDGLKVLERLMPIPYNLDMELSLYASNTDQAHQMLEQILMLFDPSLQIQTTDAAFDWTKLTTVELVNIDSEENYPAGPDRRMIIWTLQFIMPIWLSPPMDVKNNIIKEIVVQLGDLKSFHLMEYDEEGNLVPFDHENGGDGLYSRFRVTEGGQYHPKEPDEYQKY